MVIEIIISLIAGVVVTNFVILSQIRNSQKKDFVDLTILKGKVKEIEEAMQGKELECSHGYKEKGFCPACNDVDFDSNASTGSIRTWKTELTELPTKLLVKHHKPRKSKKKK